MVEREFHQPDFENPSFLFVLEDWLKNLLGCRFMYAPYFRTFGLRGDERVLDFGCGGGVGSRCLLRLLYENGHLTCVDTSSYWIKKAQRRLEKFSNAECRLGDIRKLDIPDSSFDVISVIHTIHDIQPMERQGFINALSQKLKRDGLFFIREPTRESHGMPAAEIGVLLTNAGLEEKEHSEAKSEYMGQFTKRA